MASGDCGHPPSELDEAVLRCAHPACQLEPALSVVSVGPSLANRPCWRIAGACERHETEVLAAARLDLAEHPLAEPRPMSPIVHTVLDWIHSGGRCAIDCVSLVTPPEP